MLHPSPQRDPPQPGFVSGFRRILRRACCRQLDRAGLDPRGRPPPGSPDVGLARPGSLRFSRSLARWAGWSGSVRARAAAVAGDNTPLAGCPAVRWKRSIAACVRGPYWPRPQPVPGAGQRHAAVAGRHALAASLRAVRSPRPARAAASRRSARDGSAVRRFCRPRARCRARGAQPPPPLAVRRGRQRVPAGGRGPAACAAAPTHAARPAAVRCRLRGRAVRSRDPLPGRSRWERPRRSWSARRAGQGKA